MVGSRHQRACLNADLSMGQIGPNMKAVNRLHIIQEPGIHHRSGTADGGQLLGRLEDQFYGSVDLVSSLEQKLGCAQKPGHMIIMSAGMHHAVVSGLILDVVHLLDLQRVHIRPEADDLAFLRAVDDADHAVAAYVFNYFVAAHFLQISRNLLGGFHLVLGGLGILMKISSDFRKLRHQSFC